ncbi:TetR/AcrR family transcriptional regulator [Chengkuizengella sp. SCS-71B]|uniref:TetR/AcrR family transcriptional regulator n=1 Tax=Chengkuizengella sp. SCS-71B TaxID=3115290 RepID=UPI0032C228A6
MKNNMEEQNMDNKLKYITKLIPYAKKLGLKSLRIDEIAKYMDISKATMYKYFSSKDEMVELMINMYVKYISKYDIELINGKSSYLERFEVAFEQTLLIEIYISDIFLLDLQNMYTELYEKIKYAKQKRNQNLLKFYEQGISDGVFNDINSKLILIEDELMIRKLLDPNLLIKHDITMKQAIFDLYRLKKFQLFKHNEQYDDTNIIQKIEQIIHKQNV